MRSRVIAIAGAKGSPGCSFLSVALARSFAESNIPTLLVDGDAEGGGLAALLDPGSPASPSGDDGNVHTVQLDARLWFAEIGRNEPGVFNGLEIAANARSLHQAVVLDLGHSLGTVQRQLSAASDWLLWVVVPDRSGLDRADRALASGVLGAASVGLVFNRIRRGSLEHADEVLSSRHRMPVMARIKEDRRIAGRLSQGRSVHRAWGLRRTISELARSVHPDANSAAPAWP